MGFTPSWSSRERCCSQKDQRQTTKPGHIATAALRTSSISEARCIVPDVRARAERRSTKRCEDRASARPAFRSDPWRCSPRALQYPDAPPARPLEERRSRPDLHHACQKCAEIHVSGSVNRYWVSAMPTPAATTSSKAYDRRMIQSLRNFPRDRFPDAATGTIIRSGVFLIAWSGALFRSLPVGILWESADPTDIDNAPARPFERHKGHQP